VLLFRVLCVTRKDGMDFLSVAPKMGIKVTTKQYPLRQANEALADLRGGRFEGAAVLTP
jgi:propanol-preferring alcohol dehydrogenase